MSDGNSRHRADFFIPNGRPKRLWMKELEPHARRKACAVPLAPEHAGARVEAAHGVLPCAQPQRRSLVEVEDGAPVALAVMDQKENTARCELKVAQQLLAAIPALDGKTITADPLHCQRETARIIVEKGGEYLLQIKANQPSLLATARAAPRGSPLLSRPPADTGASKHAP